MIEAICENCKFFDRKADWDEGLCKRYPPILRDPDLSGLPSQDKWQQPVMYKRDWCGEFEAHCSRVSVFSDRLNTMSDEESCISNIGRRIAK